jgi:polyferredoxin
MIDTRRLVQTLCFAGFVAALLLAATNAVPAWLFGVHPLGLGAAAVSARVWLPVALVSLALLGVTVFFGRVFCGWACPLGAFFDLADFVAGWRVRHVAWRRAKLHVLIVVALLAAGGTAWAWFFDPLMWAARLAGLFSPVVVAGGSVLGALGMLIAAEAWLGRRGFCRVLCPLGGLLGLLAGRSFHRLRITDACTNCGECVRRCRGAVFDGQPRAQRAGECVQCRECQAVCPVDAIEFDYWRRPAVPAFSAPRRSFLISSAGGVSAALVFGFLPEDVGARELLRPPGAVPEARLRSLCLRCGACVRACPTGGIVSRWTGGGLRWSLTPRLSGRAGGCAYECHACGRACPTGALRPLPLERKQRLKLGEAQVDPTRCLPQAKHVSCQSCYVVCPLHAIELRPLAALAPWGEPLRKPVVLPQKCTGCGLCEAVCPAPGQGAIHVLPAADQTPLPG